ncbi:MAG: hypothetical protein H6673_08990 [Anaerolineales bacterium]|nr:hypothetical protein [Anaerolineales bacterium]
MSSYIINPTSNVAVIIRSAHERTEALCLHLVKQQVPENNIVVIHERPFSTALRRSFEIGLDYGLDWTLCLDADILAGTSAIHKLVTHAESIQDKLFSVQGRMLDRLFNGYRFGGMHLYQTSRLDFALERTQITKEVLRPETYVKEQMKAYGFHIAKSNDRLCLHDYHQYYRDIFRKGFVHSRKHFDKPEILPIWRFLAQSDMEFVIAIEGWSIGKKFAEKIYIDIATLPRNIDHIFLKYNISEKQDSIHPDETIDIDTYITNGSPEYLAWLNHKKRLDVRLALRWQQGPVYFWPWLIGTTLRHILRPREASKIKQRD